MGKAAAVAKAAMAGGVAATWAPIAHPAMEVTGLTGDTEHVEGMAAFS